MRQPLGTLALTTETNCHVIRIPHILGSGARKLNGKVRVIPNPGCSTDQSHSPVTKLSTKDILHACGGEFLT